MNLDNVAKLVHELANGTNSSSVVLQLKSLCEMTRSEFNVISQAFSRVELSGNSLVGSKQPAGFWA